MVQAYTLTLHVATQVLYNATDPNPACCNITLHFATQVLYNTIDAVLARGEKLDDLIDKSDSLSMQVRNPRPETRNRSRCSCEGTEEGAGGRGQGGGRVVGV